MENFEEDIAAVASISAVPTILDIVCRTTGMRFAAVARVTEDRWIACSVRDDIAFGLVPGSELKVKTTICDEIRQSGNAVVIDHVAQDAQYRDHHTPAMYGLQSYISMPILLKNGTFFGTLCAIDPEPHILNTPETVEMFKMFADVIGFHLSTIDGMTNTQRALQDEQDTSALREQFIAVLGHDLRNPLAAVDGGLRLLQKTPLNEKALNVVSLMQDSVDRMAALIDNIMDFARGRLGGGISVEVSTLDADATLMQVLSELQSGAPDRQIVPLIDVGVPIRADRQRLAQLASNLLANALTHGAPEKPIRIAATTSEGWFEFYVANHGAPIPPEKMATIFEAFRRGSGRQSQQGLGLGLYIANEIAKAHNGTLDVTSTDDETRFTFRMPLR